MKIKSVILLCITFFVMISAKSHAYETDCVSFVLTDEGDDKLIQRLVDAGCNNLYQALVYLRNNMDEDAPAALTSKMDALIDTLDGIAPYGEVWTASLSDFTGGNSPVGINADGTFIRANFSIKTYEESGDYFRYNGKEFFTYALSPEKYIYMGSSEVDMGGGITKTVNYRAFAVAWSMENNPTTFVISNEGGLIDSLIAAGYGNSNLYETLVALQPTSGGVISDAFLATLAACPAGSEIFTASLSNFAGLNNPVCINSDGTLGIQPIFGRHYHRQTGYATYPEDFSGEGREIFTYATSPEYYINAGERITQNDTTHYKAFAIAWSNGGDIRTFVISNESPGYLIDKLIAAGHGDDNLYEVLQLLAADSASGIPGDFVNEVGSNTSGSEVFTATLNIFAGLNNPVCINTDGTLMIASIYGKDYDGDAGFVTNMVYYSSIGLANLTITSDLNYFIDTGHATQNDTNQNYQAIGIAYANHSRSFVLSNELGTENDGGLIDQLIAAGHGDDNLYEVLQFLAADSASGIPADFVAELGTNASTCEVFTNTLNMIKPAGGPFCINADGTITIQPIYARDVQGRTGYSTHTVYYPETATANFTMANSPNYYVNAGLKETEGEPGSQKHYYWAIGIAWSSSNQVPTFILSNEEGGLIDKLIVAGYGNNNLYEVLQLLQPVSGGAISNDYMAVLSACPTDCEAKTAILSNFSSEFNNPIGIGADGNLIVAQIYGHDYEDDTAFTTTPGTITGVGTLQFTAPDSESDYIDAGTLVFGGVTYYYQAIGIAWSKSIKYDTTKTIILSNEMGSQSSGGLLDMLVSEGYGNSSLFDVLQLLQPHSQEVINTEFMNLLAKTNYKDVFEAPLQNFADSSNNPIGIGENGMLIVAPVYGRDLMGKPGFNTISYNRSGTIKEMFTYATSPEFYIDAGSNTIDDSTTIFKAYAVIWVDTITTGIYDNPVEKRELIISPNPAGDYIEINLDRWTPSEIKIYNYMGECVMVEQTSLSVNNGQTGTSDLLRIDISHLPVGLYFIQIGNYSEKFMVVR